MVAPVINEGWLYLSDGTNSMLVYFEECKWDFVFKPTIRHFAGPGHLGYHLGDQWLVWKFKKIKMTSHTNYSNFIDYLKNWMNTSPFTFTLSVKRTSGGDLIEFDGDNTAYTVMIADGGFKDCEKTAQGDQDSPYDIGMLIFEQAG